MLAEVKKFLEKYSEEEAKRSLQSHLERLVRKRPSEVDSGVYLDFLITIAKRQIALINFERYTALLLQFLSIGCPQDAVSETKWSVQDLDRNDPTVEFFCNLIECISKDGKDLQIIDYSESEYSKSLSLFLDRDIIIAHIKDMLRLDVTVPGDDTDPLKIQLRLWSLVLYYHMNHIVPVTLDSIMDLHMFNLSYHVGAIASEAPRWLADWARIDRTAKVVRDRKKHRQEMIRRLCKEIDLVGRTPHAIASLLQQRLPENWSVKTIRRDLEDLGIC